MTRRLSNPITSEIEYDDEEFAFLQAIERYKHENRRPYPTIREILFVLKSLGYRRVAPIAELPTFYVQPCDNANRKSKPRSPPSQER